MQKQPQRTPVKWERPPIWFFGGLTIMFIIFWVAMDITRNGGFTDDAPRPLYRATSTPTPTPTLVVAPDNPEDDFSNPQEPLIPNSGISWVFGTRGLNPLLGRYIYAPPESGMTYWATGVIYDDREQYGKVLDNYRRYVEMAGTDADEYVVERIEELENP